MDCKDCKYWQRYIGYDEVNRNKKVSSQFGTCDHTIHLDYYAQGSEIQRQSNGVNNAILGDNVYTGQNYGCKHFETTKPFEHKQKF